MLQEGFWLCCVQGDWGTQFGMLIQHIAETRPGGLEGTTTEDVSDLQALYKASKQRFDAEPDFKARAREAVTRLQSGDAEFKEVSCCHSFLAWLEVSAASSTFGEACALPARH